ncbi:MAG: histidine kinase [Vicinamibacterales bacterium]
MRPMAWAYSAAVFLVLAASSASAVHVDLTRAGRAVAWGTLFVSMLPSAALWAAVSPLLVELARRRPVASPRRLANGAILGAAGAAWLATATFATVAIDRWSQGLPPVSGATASVYPIGVLIDALIVAGLLTFGTQWHLRDRAREAERALAVENARLLGLLARSELLTLRARLQPHFLFNALGAVGALVRKGEASHAISMLAGLGDLLRSALQSEKRPYVPLDEELALAARYLDIQAVRFGPALTWNIEASPDARVCAVPCLVLQPLLENAVVHGIERSPEPGRVHIDATIESGGLVVRVINDGPGLPAGFQAERDGGEGLTVTRERLAVVGGGLAFRPREGGVCAEIRVPRSPVAGSVADQVSCAS